MQLNTCETRNYQCKKIVHELQHDDIDLKHFIPVAKRYMYHLIDIAKQYKTRYRYDFDKEIISKSLDDRYTAINKLIESNLLLNYGTMEGFFLIEDKLAKNVQIDHHFLEFLETIKTSYESKYIPAATIGNVILNKNDRSDTFTDFMALGKRKWRN